MIDTHCHLLHGIDDGPRNLQGSVELARSLVDGGVHTVVCTPHFSRRYPTERAAAERSLSLLRGELDAAGLGLDLRLAAEISSVAALEAPGEELRRRRLGERYLLVELEPATPAAAVELVLDRIRGIGLMPIFAHPERCRAVRSQPHVLDDARSAGAPIQVVVQSLSGRWGEEIERSAWQLLESGRVDLVATDAHRPKHAGERLRAALSTLVERFGDTALRVLTDVNPRQLIDPGWGLG